MIGLDIQCDTAMTVQGHMGKTDTDEDEARPMPSARRGGGANILGPVWSRIADDIARAIERGEHAPGTVLPGAAELAGHYGVNRHTVRQALLHLQGLGMLAVERGRGTSVVGSRVPYKIGRRVSMRTNFAAAGMDVTGEILGHEQRVATAEEAAALAIRPGAAVWVVRTRSRAAGAVVSSGLHVLPVARFEAFPAKLLAARGSISGAFRAYGIDDYVRLSTRLSADVAGPAEAEWLEIAVGAPLMRSRAVDGLTDGTPLQAMDSLFAGSRVEMLIEPTG